MALTRRKVLITGAAGGMGRACARLLGMTADLVLTDVVASKLEVLAEELKREGYTVAGVHAGDLAASEVQMALVGHLSGGAPFTLVHTAGLSPSQADWRKIMSVNLIATERLLRAIEPHLTAGSVAVLIASMAGYSTQYMPDATKLLAEPLAPEFLERIGEAIDAVVAAGTPAGPEGVSYSFSKQAVLALTERRASSWGAKGARIVSVSPGMILTPMGRQEMDKTPGASMIADAAPAGRCGTAMDIALAVQFLASDAASFITGADLRIDGGTFSVIKQMVQMRSGE